MFKDQIEAGAKLLNKEIPGWLESIDLAKLDLSDPCNCVVGQAFPENSYVMVLMSLFPDANIDGKDDPLFKASEKYGFATGDPRKYPQLTKEWKAYIQERRNG